MLSPATRVNNQSYLQAQVGQAGKQGGSNYFRQLSASLAVRDPEGLEHAGRRFFDGDT